MISELLLRDSGGSVIAASSSDRFSHLDFFPHPNLAVSPHESQQTAPAPPVLSVGITQPAARRRLHILSFPQQENCTLCSRPYEWRSGKLEEMAEKAEAK